MRTEVCGSTGSRNGERSPNAPGQLVVSDRGLSANASQPDRGPGRREETGATALHAVAARRFAVGRAALPLFPCLCPSCCMSVAGRLNDRPRASFFARPGACPPIQPGPVGPPASSPCLFEVGRFRKIKILGRPGQDAGSARVDAVMNAWSKRAAPDTHALTSAGPMRR